MAAMAEEVNMKRRKLCDADLLRSHNEDDENGLHVQFINSYIGDGVFTKKQFYKGQLLLEYRGKLMLAESLDVSDSTYVYFFNHSNKTYCIDATHNLCVGRKVNDVDKASKANCKMRKIEVDGIPRLGLFALNDIKMNEELRYDYGDRKAPWRKLKKNDDKPILYKQTSNVKSYTECSKVFVCSGKQSIQEQIIKLVTAFGGRFEKEFSERTTHVIMETGIEGKRICNRTKKYFLGIAHHCWILNSKYVEMSLESGHYLSEEEYEIEGDQAFRKGFGAKLSRKDPKLLLEGVAFNFVGEGKDFPREAAEDIVLALGGMLGGEKSLTVSLDESGEPHTVDRTWLFDTLSLFTHLEPVSYLFENLSYTEEEMDCENADNDIKPEICSMESSYSNTDLYKTKQSSEMKDIGTDNLDLADNENCSVMKDIGSEENNNEENGNLDLADDENCSGMKDIGSEENNNEGNGNLDLADDENCSVMNDVGSEENNNEGNDNLDLADDENCSVMKDIGSEENNNEENGNLDLADDENCSVMKDIGSEENNNEENGNLDLADDENCSGMKDIGSEENNNEENGNLDLADDENCSVMNDVGSEENNNEGNDNLDLADDENCSGMKDIGSEENNNEGNDNLDLADDENCSVMNDVGSEENNNEGNGNLDLADDENCSVMNDVGSEENNNEENGNLDLADDENCSVMKDIGSEENNNEGNDNLDLADDENCSVSVMNDVGSKENNNEENGNLDLADDENCSVMNDVGSEENNNEGNDNLDLADDENCSVMKDIGSEENNNEGNDNLDLADDENCSVMKDIGSEENNNEGNDNLDLADDENCSVMKDIGSEENNNEENGNLDLADDENCSVMNDDFDLADDEIGLIIYCDSDGDYIPERDDLNSDSDDDDDDDNYPEMRDLDSSDKNYAELKNLHSNVNIVPDSNTEDESDDNMSGIIPIGDGPISFRTENPKQTTCQDDRKNSSSVTKNFLVPQPGGSSCDEKFAENSQARDMKKMYVSMSKRSKEGKRLWDKKHACLYCGKLYPKLARHLTDVHSNELDVSRALAFKKKSKERKAVWREIMNNGDCQHNAQVLQHQEGEIIPFKRPTELRDGTDYIQCDKCSGTFLRKDIWRHVKNVHPRQEGDQKGKKRHQVASAALVPVSEVARKEFQNIILNKMSNDKISLISRNDADIVLFGQRMFQKHGNKRHQHQYIRTKMRELARFVEHVRTIDTTVLTLGDCIDGLKFSTCVEATKSLCGYSKDKLSFEKPSLARKLGHSLHKVARQVKTKAMKIGNQEMKEKALNFIEIYKEDWDNEVSHMAGETLETQKYNKPRRLPLAEDLKALSVHLKGEAEILCEAFSKKHASETEWRKLCEVTLAQVVLFNKRRSGEAERLEVKQYIDGTQQGKTIQEEILLSLSPLERKLAEVIDRVEIRGKRGRRVAILLPENIKKQLDILLKYRSVGSIQNDNIYMFARPGDAEFPVRATDVLRRFGNSCGAKRPELLTSTLFRKHIAVIAQMLNLKENELDVLAGFLGHDIGVHREFYRLPEDTTQVAKVSKLLLELERGNIHKFQGKSLDEIQFDLEEPVEGDEESEGEESADGKLTTECNDAARDTPRDTMTNKHKTAVNRKMWTSNEQSAVKRQLEKFFFCEKLPGKHQIEEARKKEPLLMNRSWVQIKSYIKNKKITLKRKHPSSSYN